MKKILFCNILDAIHSNKISEILMLFEYFRNMYPCHRRFSLLISLIELKKHTLKEHRCKFKTDNITYLKSIVEQRTTLPKISLQCIFKILTMYDVLVHLWLV